VARGGQRRLPASCEAARGSHVEGSRASPPVPAAAAPGAAGTCASQLEGIAAAACQARREPDKAARRCRCYCRAAVGMDIAWIGAGEDAEAGQ